MDTLSRLSHFQGPSFHFIKFSPSVQIKCKNCPRNKPLLMRSRKHFCHEKTKISSFGSDECKKTVSVWIRFPMVPFRFLIDIILLAALLPDSL